MEIGGALFQCLPHLPACDSEYFQCIGIHIACHDIPDRHVLPEPAHFIGQCRAGQVRAAFLRLHHIEKVRDSAAMQCHFHPVPGQQIPGKMPDG